MITEIINTKRSFGLFLCKRKFRILYLFFIVCFNFAFAGISIGDEITHENSECEKLSNINTDSSVMSAAGIYIQEGTIVIDNGNIYTADKKIEKREIKKKLPVAKSFNKKETTVKKKMLAGSKRREVKVSLYRSPNNVPIFFSNSGNSKNAVILPLIQEYEIAATIICKNTNFYIIKEQDSGKIPESLLFFIKDISCVTSSIRPPPAFT